MELVREYLIVSFLYRQEREKRDLPPKRVFGYFGQPIGFREYSPEMVRTTVYREFGRSPKEREDTHGN